MNRVRLGGVADLEQPALRQLEGPGDQVRRERLPAPFVGGDLEVVQAPRRGDAVLGLDQLALQVAEPAVGLEVGEPLGQRQQPRQPVREPVLGAGLVLEIFFAVRLGVGLGRADVPGIETISEGGNVRALGRVLFTDYFFPFEVTSLLLVVAAIAAMVMARRPPGGRARRRAEEELREETREPAR